VADHGVQGIDGAISEQPGQSSECPPQQWCDNRVRSVLRKGFHGGSCHFLCGEFSGVATDQVADLLPRSVQLPIGQLGGNCGALPAQRRTTEDTPGGYGGRHDRGHRTISADSLECGTERRHRSDQ
jgi:hypothetical protein